MRRLVIMAIVAASAPARADDTLEDARRLEASLEYEKALAMVDRVLAHGGASPAQLAELHLLAGRLAAGLEHAPAAEDHFARVLALRPDAELPEGTSPKLTAPFAAARARSVPLHITATAADGSIAVASDADPLGLAVGIEVTLADRSIVSELHALRVALPAGATAVEVAVLDADRNRVWVGPAPVMVRAHVVAPPPLIVHDATTPIYARWATWAIVGGAALAASGITVWRFEVDQRDWNRLRVEDGQHDFSQLTALESRGRQWALAADISLGITGAAALATAIAYLTHRDADVVVTGTSIGVVGRF